MGSGIAVVVNFHELRKRPINLSKKGCLVHWLFISPESGNTCHQRLTNTFRQIIAQLVARLVAPNTARNNNVCSDKPASPTATDVVNSFGSKLLKFAINPERQREMCNARTECAVTVPDEQPPKVDLDVAKPAIFRAAV